MKQLPAVTLLILMAVLVLSTNEASARGRRFFERRYQRTQGFQTQQACVPCTAPSGGCMTDCICVLYSLSFMGMPDSWLASQCSCNADSMLDGTYTVDGTSCAACTPSGYSCPGASCYPLSGMSVSSLASTIAGTGPSPTPGPGPEKGYYHQPKVVGQVLKYKDHLPPSSTAANGKFKAVDKHYDGSNETLFLATFTINGNTYTARLFDVTLYDVAGGVATFRKEFHIGREFDITTLPKHLPANVTLKQITIDPNAIALQYDGAVTWITFQDSSTGLSNTYQVVISKLF